MFTKYDSEPIPSDVRKELFAQENMRNFRVCTKRATSYKTCG